MSIYGATCESIVGSCGGSHFDYYAPRYNGRVNHDKEEYMNILYERAKEYNTNRDLYDKLKFRKDFDLNDEDLEIFIKHDVGSIKEFFYTINDLKCNDVFMEVAEKQGWLEKDTGFILYKTVKKKINSYEHEKWLDKQRLKLVDPPSLSKFKNLINEIEKMGKIDNLTYRKIEDLIEDSSEKISEIYLSIIKADKTKTYHEILKTENSDHIKILTEDNCGRCEKYIELTDNNEYMFIGNCNSTSTFDTFEEALKYLLFSWCFRWEKVISFETSDKPFKTIYRGKIW